MTTSKQTRRRPRSPSARSTLPPSARFTPRGRCPRCDRAPRPALRRVPKRQDRQRDEDARPAQSTVTTLWVAHAVLLHEAAFNVTPRLLITSAEAGSGKTTLGDAIAQLTDALATSNISAPALYRAVEAEMTSVFFCDEFDVINRRFKSGGNEDRGSSSTAARSAAHTSSAAWAN